MTNPPATKCAHDFATGAGFVAIEAYFEDVMLSDSAVLSEGRSDDDCLGEGESSDAAAIVVFMEN